MTNELTQRGCERLHYHGEGKKPDYHWDSLVPGFALRISPQGKKVWHIQARCNGKMQTWKIADFGVLPSIKEARSRAAKFVVECREGRNPNEARRQQQAEKEAAEAEDAQQAAADAFTVAVMFDQYLARSRVKNKPRTCAANCGLVKRILKYTPEFGPLCWAGTASAMTTKGPSASS